MVIDPTIFDAAVSPNPERDLPVTAAPDYASWCEKRSVVLIPVGALEQHGPHMPLGTDALLSHAVARGACDLTNAKANTENGSVKVAQPFVYGYKSQQKSGGGHHLPGTISLDAQTLTSYARDITRGFLAQGVSSVVFVNGHYENYQFLYEGVDLALRDLGISERSTQNVLLLSYWDYVDEATLAKVYPDGFPGWDIEHGGVLETALMMRLYPSVVNEAAMVDHPAADLPRFDRLPAVPERTPATGCLSSPRGASREKGEWLFSAAASAIASDLLHELNLT
ncbi:creatininase [Dermabacter sp. p3-SID358]|uniref:creatininase n=1 Tax=Dermabacter sp. p3-SID358 TaxID=2916114 RepID=UPI0021A79B74|nr:creatininase [Dermabacter sp. p3-SID358]MCT1867368.1 creatininase [Dermabacter sp. p3-SID358]